jgi:predicted transcriptional regulator
MKICSIVEMNHVGDQLELICHQSILTRKKTTVDEDYKIILLSQQMTDNKVDLIYLVDNEDVVLTHPFEHVSILVSKMARWNQ